MKTAFSPALFCALSLSLVLAGCSGSKTETTKIAIDGSSTVFPITAAVAEEFNKVDSSVRISVAVSGTGGGMKKFGVGETDISNASRPIKEKEEKRATDNQIGFVEIPVAFDGISVVVNKNNSFVDHLTVAELEKIWSASGGVTTWQDVRAEWPAEKIALYGPGTASGTFDYFVEAILGKEGSMRSDFSANEDDNVLVTGVAGDDQSLGFFGFAYYAENQERLKVVPIKNGSAAPVEPSMASINNGTYAPLSRPIFIYVSTESAKRPEVQKFVHFYLENAAKLSEEVGYVALPKPVYTMSKERFEAGITGTIFRSAEAGTDIEQLMHAAAQKAE